MPWLFGTALIHALMVTDKRGGFKAWSVLLAIGAFSLCLLGTFLVRSGVLTSVHAFANDPERGIFILILLALVVGISLMLFAWRAPKATLAVTLVWYRESLAPDQQCAAGRCHRRSAVGHHLSPHHRCTQPRQTVGWRALLQRGICAIDGARYFLMVPGGHCALA